MGPEANNPGAITQRAEANNQMTEKDGDGAKQDIQGKTEARPEDQESNQTPPETTDEPSAHEYATPRELALLSTVFTIATFMIAIDGSILGRKLERLTSPNP